MGSCVICQTLIVSRTISFPILNMATGPFMVEQAEDDSGDNPDLSQVLLERGTMEIQETGPFPCLPLARHNITKRCYRVLDIGESRYLSIEEIGRENE